jgi:serine/threonine-protein kinase RsbW
VQIKKKIEKTLILKSKASQIKQVESFLEEINKHIHLDEIKYNKLLVATTEAVNNSIIHGNKRDPKKKVIIKCSVTRSTLTIRIQDEGKGINPTRLPNPLSKKNLLRENGRGVFLMRSLMKSVEFERILGGSVVIMTMDL